jgi:hypothetical protein
MRWERWGRRYGVSANNASALLAYVGEDVAGAAQFVRKDRLGPSQDPGAIEPVGEDYVEQRLRSLREDRAEPLRSVRSADDLADHPVSDVLAVRGG